MKEPVSVLLLEHRAEDARILEDLLASSEAGLFAVECFNCILQYLSVDEARNEHHIVLLDLDLPDGGGHEAIRQLRTRAGSVPIITLASADGDAAGTQSIANGAQDHLVKWHFDGRSLGRAIRHAIQRQQMVESLHSATAALAEQLKQQQVMASIGQRTTELAHHFGNLVFVIEGWSSRSRRFLEDRAAVAKSLSSVEKAARQASSMVESLRNYAGLTASRPKMPVNIGAVIDDMSDLLCRLLPENVSLTHHLGNRVLWASADRIDLERVILNLTINACRAMPGGGTLELTLSLDKSEDLSSSPVGLEGTAEFIHLEVRDTGVGIPPEVRPHIFEPFFTTTPRETAGLGLSIVRGIVDDLGGLVKVQSEPGTGTTVTLILPCCEPPTSSLEVQTTPLDAQRPSSEIPSLRGTRVLLACKSAPTRGIIGALLQSLGLEVCQSVDKLADARREEYEAAGLIVLHRDALDEGAVRHMSKLRNSGPSPPVIIIMAESDLGTEVPAYTVLLREPFSAAKLRYAVCQALGAE